MRASGCTVAMVGAQDPALLEALRSRVARVTALRSRTTVALTSELRAERTQLVHAREALLPAALAARACRTPSVLEVRAEQLGLVTTLAGRLATRVVTGQGAVRDALIAAGVPAARIAVLRGLTAVPLTTALPFPPQLDPALRWVICAAPAEDPDRGVADALLAFLSLARTRPRLRLLLNASPHAALPLFAQVEASGLAGRVLVRELLPGQLPSLLRHAAVVVAPSRSGAHTDAIPEALASGAAVIGTAVGPHPGWIREGRSGFLVPPRAPVALAARLATMVDDVRLLTRLREGARHSALDAAAPDALAAELVRCHAAVAWSPAPRAPALGGQLLRLRA